MPQVRLPPDLGGILKERTSRFSYRDLTLKKPSGMTQFQEWLRSHGIKEGTEPKDGYVCVPHPQPWTKSMIWKDTKPTQLLLIPGELAIKIATLGHMP